MAIADSRISVWEALAGRAPGHPVGPADPGLWSAVAERINPAKARPVLRAGIEMVEMISARGMPYVMLRSPDPRNPCYVRLTPDEVRLARLMDGSRTVARLVADFTRITGRLAPDQVRRVVADLAGNRMLEELPVDAFAPLRRVQRRPWPLRFGRALLLVAQGRRMVVANIDPLVTFLYRAGGRLLFTRVAAALMGTVAVLGLVAFGYQWWAGEQSVFLSSNSYVTGALVLLGLNVFALACHEVGHALATKHAGRRVPNAGFLVYFGIPSVFVDTTDVWMAGRRARLLATAAGPGAGLVLAGAASLLGFAFPAAAPICFKLAFAWYLNALFNLNPFLALDGYYLLMDWLEIPNLRARGLAWVAARVRRRPPSWSALDREGRLVALYGLLAVGWLVVALNIAYRLYVDRVGGLVTGLWRSGWGARVLLVTVILALASPLVYILAGWSRRGLRGLARRIGERRVERDEPRRLAALRDSALRDLPEPALRALAAQARWRHPRTGEQLVIAGGAQPDVFVVVDGALEARAPGDPAGSVRERVGVGGIVGLAPAMTGAPSALHWYTAGTTLLAIPSAAVASAVGPLAVGGAAATDRFGTAGEAEQLFAEAPGLAALSTEDRLGLARVAVPIALAPNAPLTLDGGDTALIVSAGIVVTPDGQELGRGTMIGPVGDEYFGPIATARTAVRAFSIPAVSGLALLLGTPAAALAADAAGRTPGRAPVTGVHPPAAYPPLSPPPGPPPPTADDSADRRFEKRLRWLLILALLLGLLFTSGNVALAAQPWTEMPTDKALLHIEVGTAKAVVNGVTHDLGEGDDIYVGESDSVTVDPTSRALLTFRGGASALLCAGTDLLVGPLTSTHERPGAALGRDRGRVVPSAAFDLRRGRTVADTTSATPAFVDLSLSVETGRGTVRNDGAALYSVEPSRTVVSVGTVFVGDTRQREVGGELGCGDGSSRSPSPTATPGSTATPTASPSATPSATATPSPSASPSASPSSSTSTTTTSPPTTTTTTTTPSVPPRISWIDDPGSPQERVAQMLPHNSAACDGQSPLAVAPRIRDDGAGGADQVVRVTFSWSGFINGSQTVDRPNTGNEWMVVTDTVPYSGVPNNGGSFAITVEAFDAQGQSTVLQSAGSVLVTACRYQNRPPSVTGVKPDTGLVYATECQSQPQTTRLTINVTDPDSTPGQLSVQVATWLVPEPPFEGQTISANGGAARFSNGAFIFDWGPRGTHPWGVYTSQVRVRVTVTDQLNASSSATFDGVFRFRDCWQG